MTVTASNVSDFLTLGRGELWFSPYKTGTTVEEGFFFIGNCPEFTLTVSEENLDHFSSISGIRTKDKTVSLEKTVEGAFTTDTIADQNVALFLGGLTSTISQAATTATVSTFTGVKQGRSYQLGVTAGRVTGLRRVSAVVVTNGGTTYTVTTDYTVDAERGMIYIVPGGTIADAGNITVTFNSAAYTMPRVTAEAVQAEGAMKFISRNASGPQRDLYMPYVKLSPGGDMGLISEEFAEISIAIEVLKRGDLAFIYGDGGSTVVV